MRGTWLHRKLGDRLFSLEMSLRFGSNPFFDGLPLALKGWDWFGGRFLKARFAMSGKKTSRNLQKFCLVQREGA
jgi:hypothetical protein